MLELEQRRHFDLRRPIFIALDRRLQSGVPHPLLGTASLQPAPANTGVGGINASDYQFFRHWNHAYYFANYTRWFDDRVASLVGFRCRILKN